MLLLMILATLVTTAFRYQVLALRVAFLLCAGTNSSVIMLQTICLPGPNSVFVDSPKILYTTLEAAVWAILR